MRIKRKSMARWFAQPYEDERLDEVAEPINRAALDIQELLPESAEKTTCLRMLRNARDCVIYARMEEDEEE